MAQTATRSNKFVLAGMLSAVAASSIYVMRRGDLDTYIHAGYAVLLKRDIYTSQPPGNNTWPPFFSVLCVPLALLDTMTPYLARGVWQQDGVYYPKDTGVMLLSSHYSAEKGRNGSSLLRSFCSVIRGESSASAISQARNSSACRSASCAGP